MYESGVDWYPVSLTGLLERGSAKYGKSSLSTSSSSLRRLLRVNGTLHGQHNRSPKNLVIGGTQKSKAARASNPRNAALAMAGILRAGIRGWATVQLCQPGALQPRVDK